MLMDVGGILSRVGAIVDFSLGSQRDFSREARRCESSCHPLETEEHNLVLLKIEQENVKCQNKIGAKALLLRRPWSFSAP